MGAQVALSGSLLRSGLHLHLCAVVVVTLYRSESKIFRILFPSTALTQRVLGIELCVMVLGIPITARVL